MTDILDDLVTMSSHNLVSNKSSRSLLGKLGHAAGLLIIMRPFMDPLWAAWSAPFPEVHPGCIWTKQIQTELTWFLVFFRGQGTTVERFFTLDAYNRTGTIVEIGTDASPWGLGGWLAINGTITQYFSSALSAFDTTKFGIQIGDTNGQQLWEALAVLVVVDLWSAHWHQQRIVLKVRSDNVTALTLLTKMRPPSPSIAVVARELAMRLVHLSFPPDAEHTPGVGHVLADKLSRVYAPVPRWKGDVGSTGVLEDISHPALPSAQEAQAPARDDTWHRV